MNKLSFKIMMIASLFGLFGCRNANDPAKWSPRHLNTWFDKGEWLNGMKIKPDATIDRKEFAASYFRHKERWDKAFAFLRDVDLKDLELKCYDLDGTDLYATVSEYMTKNEENAMYELHKKYIDIQYVVSGKEQIGIAPVSSLKEILVPYDDGKDIMFLAVNRIINFKASPDRFFILFPDFAHRPCLKDGESSMVRKVVVKLMVD